MPIVDITMIEGRPPERKRALIWEVTDTVERVLGVPRDTIRVVLREVPPQNYGVAGVPKA
jgi:4-oxalocrotonate tautomerase